MNKARLTAFSLALATAACGGMNVNTDFDPAYNFQGAQTFVVMDPPSGPSLPGLNDARVKQSIATVMESKGLRQVADTSQADLAVGYQFTTEEKRSYNTVNSGWGSYGYGGYGGWYGGYPGGAMTTSTTTETRYDVGSLLIAAFDTEARQMVYASTGSRTLSDSQRSPEETQRRIDEAVAEILGDFPPGG